MLPPEASYSTEMYFPPKANPASLRYSPRKRSKSRTRRSKVIGSNIRGVISVPRSDTQVALLTSSARGENRAHEFHTCFYFQGPWAVRLVVDDVPFLVSYLKALELSFRSVVCCFFCLGSNLCQGTPCYRDRPNIDCHFHDIFLFLEGLHQCLPCHQGILYQSVFMQSLKFGKRIS